MKIRIGGTRIVFLFSKFVVKIPRLLILTAIGKTLKFAPKGQFGNKLKGLHPDSKVKAMIRYIFVGVFSNINEIKYFKEHSNSLGLLPVKCFFWGFLLIQERGEDILETDVGWKNLSNLFRKNGIKEVDILRPCNFCRLRGKIKILDYGRSETQEDLSNQGLKIIESFA